MSHPFLKQITQAALIAAIALPGLSTTTIAQESLSAIPYSVENSENPITTESEKAPKRKISCILLGYGCLW
ncbi:MAG: hypothetical protein AAF703_21480 [Cyanobacteria bacterium P01_D01_bin.105]